MLSGMLFLCRLAWAASECLCRYAKLEKGLGEIDRARAIYIHASAMADPRRDTEFWADWNAFEVIMLVLYACVVQYKLV